MNSPDENYLDLFFTLRTRTVLFRGYDGLNSPFSPLAYPSEIIPLINGELDRHVATLMPPSRFRAWHDAQ